MEPGAQLAQRPRGGGVGLLELRLERRVLHGGEHRRDVRLQIAGEPAEGHLPQLGVGARHRGAQVGSHLPRRARDGPGVVDERPHPRASGA